MAGTARPSERDPEAVAADVAAGRVSRRRASRAYGVVLRRDGRPDEARTAARRAALRAEVGCAMSGRLRLAVDIGGTFTDGVLLEDGTDRTWTHKVLTTPDDPSDGFIAVDPRAARRTPMSGCAISSR